MSDRMKWMGGLLLLAACECSASWMSLLEEPFDASATNRWTYAGVSNSQGQALFRLDATSGVVQAEWDQANSIAAGSPYAIRTSRLLTPLPRPLTDRDTFRLRARLVIAPGTLVESVEYHQIANVGLYNPGAMGADRAMADNYDFSASPKVKDGSDFVEFNYFVGHDPHGTYPFTRSAEMTIGAHTDGTGDYHFNYQFYGDPWWHNTAMGQDGRLPEGASLYLELVYFGASTNDDARRGYMALYEDAARTRLVTVNGIAMYYWTWAVPEDRTFTVTHAGVYNYVNLAYYGAPIAAAGQLDDLQVDQEFAETEMAAAGRQSGGVTLQWAATPGATYAVLGTGQLAGGLWTTQGVVVAQGDFAGFTNTPSAGLGILRVERILDP